MSRNCISQRITKASGLILSSLLLYTAAVPLMEKLHWICAVITDIQMGSSIVIKLYDNVKGHDYVNLRLYHICFLKEDKTRELMK